MLNRVVDAHLALLGAPLEEIAQHVFHIYAHLFHALRPGELDDRKILFADFDFDLSTVELATAKLRAKFFSRALRLVVSGSGGGVCARFTSRLFPSTGIE